jgi:probable F420-dependent oxidoreductase
VYLATNVFSLVDSAAATDLLDLAHVVEEVGFDELDLGDHVTIGRPAPGRRMPGPPAAALLEPLVALGAIAAVTRRIRLGTGVLILPQRQPALVAKQVATLDRLSNGRVRLAVGVGWQAPEYESLGVPFGERGRRMDEAIELLRLYWTRPSVTYHGHFYHAEAMAVDPPPVQPGGPPVWLGGGSEAALRRVGRVADGWLAVGEDPRSIGSKLSVITRAAQDAGRDPRSIGLQVLLGESSDLDRLAAEASAFREAGFSGASVNLDHVIASGARDLDRQRHTLARIKERLDQETR